MEQIVATNEECGGEIWELHDLLSRDEEDPGTRAARRMDWSEFIAGLSAQDQTIIQFMAEGTQGPAIARKLGVCSSTIHHRKRTLAEKILAFHGPDILVQVQSSPRWKESLDATRERLACKHDRAH